MRDHKLVHGIPSIPFQTQWVVLESVIGGLRLYIYFHMQCITFPDCIILILFLKNCVFEKINHAGIFKKVKKKKRFSKASFEFLWGVSSSFFNIFRQRSAV